MLWGISEMVNARAFKPLPLCYGSRNVFWENAVGYLTPGNLYQCLKNFWSSRNKSKPLSQLNVMCFEKMLWVICTRALKPLPLCSAPLKTTSISGLQKISGALGTQESHFLSSNMGFQKMCGVSQKWWMLELANLYHCVMHPWKLTSSNFGSSGK